MSLIISSGLLAGLSGIFIGLRYPVLVLLPAIIALTIATCIAGGASGLTPLATFGIVALNFIILQVAYLSGAFLQPAVELTNGALAAKKEFARDSYR